MEEPCRLQCMGSWRVGHDWVTSLSLFTFLHWRRKRQPTPVFLPGESHGEKSLVGCRLWGRTELDTTVTTQQQQHSSVGKESVCNAGDPGSIPRLGRSLGEGNSNPLQYSCLENPMGREEPGRLQSMGLQKSQTWLSDYTTIIALWRPPERYRVLSQSWHGETIKLNKSGNSFQRDPQEFP